MPRRTRKPKPGRGPFLPMLEQPGKRYYQKRLNWLIRFLNEDISCLPPGDFLKLMNETLLFFYEGQYKPDIEFKTVCQDTPLNRDALERLRTKVGGIILEIQYLSDLSREEKEPKRFVTIEPKYDLVVEGDRIWFRPVKQLRPYERKPDPVFPLYNYRENSLTGTSRVDMEYIRKVFFKKEVCIDNYTFFDTLLDPDRYTSILMTLVPLLEKFPLDCFRQCPDCGKYFTSTRKKLSPLCRRCLTKRNTYKWREENPEKYNRYQSDLQKRLKQKRRSKEE